MILQVWDKYGVCYISVGFISSSVLYWLQYYHQSWDTMLTNEERAALLAVEKRIFPDDPDLGRVDTRKASISGQAWVKMRRAQIMQESWSLQILSSSLRQWRLVMVFWIRFYDYFRDWVANSFTIQRGDFGWTYQSFYAVFLIIDFILLLQLVCSSPSAWPLSVWGMSLLCWSYQDPFVSFESVRASCFSSHAVISVDPKAFRNTPAIDLRRLDGFEDILHFRE